MLSGGSVARAVGFSDPGGPGYQANRVSRNTKREPTLDAVDVADTAETGWDGQVGVAVGLQLEMQDKATRISTRSVRVGGFKMPRDEDQGGGRFCETRPRRTRW